jgi:hypothetical protein
VRVIAAWIRPGHLLVMHLPSVGCFRHSGGGREGEREGEGLTAVSHTHRHKKTSTPPTLTSPHL